MKIENPTADYEDFKKWDDESIWNSYLYLKMKGIKKKNVRNEDNIVPPIGPSSRGRQRLGTTPYRQRTTPPHQRTAPPRQRIAPSRQRTTPSR